jgi:hypothetical protein
MSLLGDALEAMHTARLRSRSVRATLTFRSNSRLWKKSVDRWESMHPSDSSVVFASRQDDAPDQPPPAEVKVSTHEVWRQYSGDLWRVESSGYYSTPGTHTVIVNGKQYWMGHSDGGFILQEADSYSVDGMVKQMVDATSFIGLLTLAASGEESRIGRHAYLLRGPVHPDANLPHEDWLYADEYRLTVDAERGVLLRFEALLDGETFIDNAVDEIAFDEALDQRLFAEPANARRPEIPRDLLQMPPEAIEEMIRTFRETMEGREGPGGQPST